MSQEKDNTKTELAGNVRALLEEYRKAINELIYVIKPITEKQLSIIVDVYTKDPDCKSIQSVLTHVVCSGYGYIIYIENYLGDNKSRPERITYDSPTEYIEALNLMFEYAINFFHKNPRLEIEQIEQSKKIIVNWGQQYDIEQLLEHAVVHILRHRRQLERFMLQLKVE